MQYNTPEKLTDIQYALALDALRCLALSDSQRPIDPSERNFKVLPLMNEEETRQLAALWRRTDETDDRARSNSERITVVERQVQHILERESEHYGQLSSSIDTLMGTLSNVESRLMRIEIMGETKDGLIDRWAPMVLSLLGVSVAAIALIKGSGVAGG